MNTTINLSKLDKKSVLGIARLFLPAMVFLVMFAAFTWWNLSRSDAVSGGSSIPHSEYIFPTSEEIEKELGVRFTFLAVTAKGGMIDLRYLVVDAEQAHNFAHYTETAPLLINEDTGEVVDTTIMGFHNHRMEQGHQYYMLYRNRADAFKPGDRVTIQLGDLALENIIVQ